MLKKKIEKIIQESAFDKKKEKFGLKFNPGLALTRVRTTSSPEDYSSSTLLRTYNGQRSQLPVCALNYLHHVRNRPFQNGGHGEGVFLG